jgi:hypothetical protein
MGRSLIFACGNAVDASIDAASEGEITAGGFIISPHLD